MSDYQADLERVDAGLAGALARLAELGQGMAALDKAGRFERAPTRIVSEPRGGDGEYMRLYFGRHPGGAWYGPGGRRKLYVGVDAERQAEALRLAENAAAWEGLHGQAEALRSWLDARRAELAALAEACDV